MTGARILLATMLHNLNMLPNGEPSDIIGMGSYAAANRAPGAEIKDRNIRRKPRSAGRKRCGCGRIISGNAESCFHCEGGAQR